MDPEVTTRAPSRPIGVRALKAHASEVIRLVRETGAAYVVTVRGRPVARIEPIGAGGVDHPADGMGNTKGILDHLPAFEWEDFQRAKRIWGARPLGDE